MRYTHSMLGTITSFATKLMGSIPVLRNFVSKTKEENNSLAKENNPNQKSIHQEREISEQGFTSPLREENKTDSDQVISNFSELRSRIESYPLKLFHPVSDYVSIANTIKSNIKRVDGTLKLK